MLPRRRAMLRLICLACCTPAANAADLYYVGPASGAGAVWNDSANWSSTLNGAGGAGVPGIDDGAFLEHSDSSPYDVRLNSNASVDAIYITNTGAGTDSLIQGGGFSLTSQSEFVGLLTGGHATHVQSDGTNTTGFLIIGNASGTGTYLLSGGTVTVNGLEELGISAPAASGTFIQTGGVHSAAEISLAAYSQEINASGYYRIEAGSLDCGSMLVGNQGSGTLIQNGGHVAVAGAMSLGETTRYSSGFVQLNAGTLSSDWLVVGSSGSGTFRQSGGTNSTGALEIGHTTDSSGTYILDGAAAVLNISGGESLGFHNGGGTFLQSAGTHTVGQGLALNGPSLFRLSGGTLSVGGYESIGMFFAATFEQTGGYHTLGTASDPGTLYLGVEAANNEFDLSGDATFIVHGNEIIGERQWGRFNQSGGYHRVVGSVSVASTAEVNLSGGTLDVDNVIIGGTSAGYFTWSGGHLAVGSLTLLARARMTVSKTTPEPLIIQSISINDQDDAQLNLTTNNMVLDYAGSAGTLLEQTRLDLLHGALLSSIDARHRLGYGDNADAMLQKPAFSGVTFPSGDFSQLLVKYTYGGDANLDGVVDIKDLFALASHWKDASAIWTQGDFDYNGVVNAADLGMLASNWQAGSGAEDAGSFATAALMLGLPSINVPEPSMLMMAFVACGVLCRRKRFRRSGVI